MGEATAGGLQVANGIGVSVAPSTQSLSHGCVQGRRKRIDESSLGARGTWPRATKSRFSGSPTTTACALDGPTHTRSLRNWLRRRAGPDTLPVRRNDGIECERTPLPSSEDTSSSTSLTNSSTPSSVLARPRAPPISGATSFDLALLQALPVTPGVSQPPRYRVASRVMRSIRWTRAAPVRGGTLQPLSDSARAAVSPDNEIPLPNFARARPANRAQVAHPPRRSGGAAAMRPSIPRCVFTRDPDKGQPDKSRPGHAAPSGLTARGRGGCPSAE